MSDDRFHPDIKHAAGADVDFDPREWAMIGLLCSYFDQAAQTRSAPMHVAGGTARASSDWWSGTRARWAPASIATLIRRRPGWWLGGGLAASVATILLMSVANNAVSRPALAAMLTKATGQVVYIPPVLDDSGRISRCLVEIEKHRNLRDEHMRAGRVHETLESWQALYNRLRDVGDWGAARTEILAALQYCTGSQDGRPALGWQVTCLDDLGSAFTAEGDFTHARAAYLDSINARIATVENDSVTPRVAAKAHSLPVMYWRLSYLALLQGDLDGARKALGNAEQLLREFIATAQMAGGQPPPSPSTALIDAFRALPDDFQHPPWPMTRDMTDELASRYWGLLPSPTIVMIVRNHLRHLARLSQLNGDLDEAARRISEARSISYYASADEYHVLFFEPLEAARTAIARQRYANALAELDEAERNAGPIVVGDRTGPDKPEIAPVYRSELNLLRGAALLGLNPGDAIGRQLVAEALELPRVWERRITDPRQRAAFRKRFDAWYELAERVGAE